MATIAPTPGAERPWEGIATSKPWHYPVTAVVPHLETPDILPLAVELLLLQTLPCYVLVVDTGSSPPACAAIEKLRSDRVEIHYVRGHGYRNGSQPVAVAMDLAFALCQTEKLFATHADCFLRRRDFVEWEASLCDSGSPVVGYQMSPRDVVNDDWKHMPSHTATMFHMPTMYRHGVTWNMERAHHQWQLPRSPVRPGNWPDTETTIGYCLRDAGIKPHFIGKESNFQRHVDDNLDHVRSYAGSKLYSRQYHTRATQWMMEATQQAEQRIEAWKRTPVA